MDVVGCSLRPCQNMRANQLAHHITHLGANAILRKLNAKEAMGRRLVPRNLKRMGMCHIGCDYVVQNSPVSLWDKKSRYSEILKRISRMISPTTYKNFSNASMASDVQCACTNCGILKHVVRPLDSFVSSIVQTTGSNALEATSANSVTFRRALFNSRAGENAGPARYLFHSSEGSSRSGFRCTLKFSDLVALNLRATSWKPLYTSAFLHCSAFLLLTFDGIFS